MAYYLSMSKDIGTSTTNILIGVLIVGAILAGGLSLWWNNRTGKNITGPSQDYEREMEELRKIPDPSLIIYTESAKPIATGFTVPRAIAVGPEDRIYVTGDQVIRRFERNGNPVGEDIFLPEAGSCVAVTQQGKIFVGLKDHVEVYDSKGKPLSRWEARNPEDRLTSIAVKDDDVFVAVYVKNFGLVYHYDGSSQFINLIQQEKSSAQGFPFDVPSAYFDVAVGADEMVHIAHTGKLQIERYTFRGHFGGKWGKGSVGLHKMEDFFGCCNPVNFALLPEEAGYITCEKGIITRVKEYDLDGNFVGIVAPPDHFPKSQRIEMDTESGAKRVVLDVAVDSKGRVLILDPFRSQVRIYTRKTN